MLNSRTRQSSVRLFSLLALAASLLAGAPAAFAVDTPAELRSTATDGKTYATKFAVSIVRPNTTTQINTLSTNETVTITGVINADPAHLNQKADVFVVMRDVNTATYYMRNLDGVFEKWSGFVTQLKPAQENVTLTANYSMPVYSGTFANAGKQMVFVGYMSKTSPALIYTPAPAQLDIKAPTSTVAPITFFSDNIESNILPRCLACHVSGGLAKESMLILERSSDSSVQHNFNTFNNVALAKGVGYILSKATGTIPHTGGVQLNLGSTDYNNMSTFLQLQQGTTEVITASGNQIFDGVTLQTRAETLRRAAIMLAGRTPSASELDTVGKGDENTLRTALRALMTGPNFHKFLTEGANDRLLTRGVLGPVIVTAAAYYPKYVNEAYNARLLLQQAGKTAAQIQKEGYTLMGAVEDGLRRSVEEQVAYVVEQERPYTEILTGDYMMMSPKLNFVMGGGATFNNPENRNEFQPARINEYYRWKPGDGYLLKQDQVLDFYFLKQPVGRYSWEHNGILNNPAFTQRYPSTATNRNRARARWTMLHFLDIDIEKSTQRPTDPAALADKNNPTMNNPACTACHERMDPVAAAFQDYSDEGYYKMQYNDSLDTLYTHPPAGTTTLYQPGDTWYRDMRSPGLLGQSINTTTPPLRQLATLITKDKGFASATVKFWWPSVMNSDVLLAPAVSTDTNYAAKLAAYQAQTASIEQFATNFRKDYNVKNLLVDMMMSPWFRARSTSNTSQRAAMAIADVGIEKLLTPERLQRKSAALTGFNWGATLAPNDPYSVWTNLDEGYNSYKGIYGGINSESVTTRVRDITPLMSTVAQTYALESSCPIIMREFGLPDSLRKLFGGITQNTLPLLQGSITHELTSTSQTDWQTVELSIDLPAGQNQITVSMDNSYCDYDATTQKCRSQRVLYLDRFEVKAPGAANFTTYEITSAVVPTFPPNCFRSGTSDAVSYGQCAIPLALNAQNAGTYEIRARIAGIQASTGNIKSTLAVLQVGDPLESTARGATLIRQKLVELHQKLHGKTYAIDAPEITMAYKLFVETLQERVAANKDSWLQSSARACTWYSDANFFDGLGFTGITKVPRTDGSYEWTTEASNFANTLNPDPTFAKQSWIVVMVYLLGHYNFLYE